MGLSMRRLVFAAFVALGAATGLLGALDDGWGVRVGMALSRGIVVGGLVSSIRSQQSNHPPDEDLDAVHPSYEDGDENYWRDKGHPPFMKPPKAAPGLSEILCARRFD